METCKCKEQESFLDRYSYNSSEGVFRFLACQGYEIIKDSSPVAISDLIKAWRVHGELPELWDANHFEFDVCKCGHYYYRHFDGFEDNYPIGCKYCDCDTFESMTLTLEQSQKKNMGLCIVEECKEKTLSGACYCSNHQPHRGF